MWLRKDDGLAYYNGDLLDWAQIQANGGGTAWGISIQVAANGATLLPTSTYGSEASAEAAVAKLIRTLQNDVARNQYAVGSDGNRWVNFGRTWKIEVVSNGDGTYNVSGGGITLSSGHASQAAAQTAMDAVVSQWGVLDVDAYV